MKEIKLKLYSYDELSTEAKERTLSHFVKEHDDPMLQVHLGNLVKEELDERKITYNEDSIDVYYSLSYCQGDGLMFVGEIEWRKRTLRIKQSGHYCHEKSRTIEVIEGDELTETQMGQFEAVYEVVCRKIRDAGYAEIEYQTSSEYFSEVCEANDWTFEEDGSMRNV